MTKNVGLDDYIDLNDDDNWVDIMGRGGHGSSPGDNAGSGGTDSSGGDTDGDGESNYDGYGPENPDGSYDPPEGSGDPGGIDDGADQDPNILDPPTDDDPTGDGDDDSDDSFFTYENFFNRYYRDPWEGIFSGDYQENLPSMSNFMEENFYSGGPSQTQPGTDGRWSSDMHGLTPLSPQSGGFGTLQDYIGAIERPELTPLGDYVSSQLQDDNFMSAWDYAELEGANRLGERLYGQGGGGSARGGHSGQGVGAYSDYYADQTYNRYMAALNTAMPEWQADVSLDTQDWLGQRAAAVDYYGQRQREVATDFGNQLQGYQLPYNIASQVVPGHMQERPDMVGNPEQANQWGSIIGGVAGGALGWYLGSHAGPGGGAYGAYTGYTIGSGLGSQL